MYWVRLESTAAGTLLIVYMYVGRGLRNATLGPPSSSFAFVLPFRHLPTHRLISHSCLSLFVTICMWGMCNKEAPAGCLLHLQAAYINILPDGGGGGGGGGSSFAAAAAACM